MKRAAASLIALALLISCSDESTLLAPVIQSTRPAHRNSTLPPDAIRTILGPVTITRTAGSPDVSRFTLAGYAPSATLRLVNGDASGKNRTTSATVTLDGVQLLGPSDFNPRFTGATMPITLKDNSVIEVRQTGTPGSTMTLSVDGMLLTSAVVGDAGGTENLLGDQVQLTIPQDALSSPITLTADPVETPPTGDATGQAVPGTSIELGPTGTTFTHPITVSIAFDPTALPAGVKPSYLGMYVWNVDHWDAVTNSTVDVANGVVSGQTTHFSTYALLPNAVEFCPTDPGAEHDLPTAVSRVPANGTIYVCDGTFEANIVVISKPMTLTSEHAGMATLRQPDTASAGTPVVVLNNVTSGTFAIVNMNFDFKYQAFRANIAFDQIVVLGSKFMGRDITQGIGLNILNTTTTTAKLTVDNTEFTGSSNAISQRQPINVDVFHSNFHDLGGFTLITQTAVGSQNPTPTGVVPVMRSARIQWNTFHNCGHTICIADEQAGMDTIRYNTITNDPGFGTGDVIFINRSGQGADMSAPVVVSDNVFHGHGPAAGEDSTDNTKWGGNGGIISNSGTAVVPTYVERNTIDGSYFGLWARPGANHMVANDNHITNTYVGVATNTGDPIEAHRNDFSNYHYPIATFSGGLLPGGTGVTFLSVVVAPSRLACNYWSSASGPVGVFSGIPVGAYTPYSVVPIAEQSGVSCDPGSIPTTVRVCPTQGGSVPTISNFTDAYSIIPAGGTILFCDGTFSLNNAPINKPITIAAEGPGTPVIDAGTNPRAFNIGNVSPAGTVTISKLAFINGANGQINLFNNSGNVHITQNDFHPGQTNPYGVLPRGGKASINLFGTTGLGTVTVDHNTFTGGDIGFTSGSPLGAVVQVTDNTFTGQSNSSVTFGSSGVAANIAIDRNSFDQCGDANCVLISQPANIRFNTFSASIARPVGQFVQVGIATGITGFSVVSDNSMVAADIGTGSRSTNSTYAVKFEAISVFSGNVTIERNTMTRAFNGVFVSSGATVVSNDNVITTTFAPFAANGSTGAGVVLNGSWNNLTDYITAISNVPAMNTSTSTLRCNWWGTATGAPSAINVSVPAAVYTPFLSAASDGSHTGCLP